MCMVFGCRGAGKPLKFSLCDGCYQERWRQLNPAKSAFSALKQKARERGIEFSLDYRYFKGIVDAYGYFEFNPDNFRDHLSIDRVDCTRGYVEGNIRVVTVSENAMRSHRERHLPEHVQAVLARKRALNQRKIEQMQNRFNKVLVNGEELPF